MLSCVGAAGGARAGNPADLPAGDQPNYGEALQKSLFFYEAQRSGRLPTGNRVSWRADSGVGDGKDVQVDLSGGLYDAGDHVKFGFPLAYTTTLLAWSLSEDGATYDHLAQTPYALSNLRWITDWMLKAHTAPDVLWGQVGSGAADHAFWGPPEVMSMARPSFKIDATCPGSDLAGETAAALAAASLVFKAGDPTYSALLLRHARELYQFADTYRGKYSDCIKDAAGFYNSWSGYQDELVWGAAWLYKATGEPAYLAKAELEYGKLPNEIGTTVHNYKFTLNWDDKSYGTYVLLAQLTGKAIYEVDAERWLDYWTTGVGGEHILVTPGGLAWANQWGALRYSAGTAMMALYYSKYLQGRALRPEKAAVYSAFAQKQIDYMLGNNPQKQSYVVGFGANSPHNIHHRGAHGSWSNNIQTPVRSRHTLYGALVGGPDQNDHYVDARDNYAVNEVALDYNAAFTGAVVRLASLHGGSVDANFPVSEVPDQEFLIESKVNAQGPNFIEIATRLKDHAAFPARFSGNLSFRYFIGLGHVPAPQRGGDAIHMTTAYDQSSGVSAVKPWHDAVHGIYYIDVSFAGQRVGPVGDWESTRETQFRFNFPEQWQTQWDHHDDWSFNKTTTDWLVNDHIAIYEDGHLVFGSEPL